MIKLEHISKTFGDTGDGVHAVKDVSLEIGDGEIFGIIGFSGAGKSTLVRCINLLERPTSGSITVNGQKLTWMEKQADGKSCMRTVSPQELRQARKKISMIFQGFNLLMQRTCLKNVCFPMELSGVPKAQAEKKALELLDEAPSVKEQARADGLLLGNRCLIYIQMNQLDKAADCLTRLEAMVKADKNNALGGDVVQSARCLRIRLNASKGWATDVAWVKAVAASGQLPFYAASNQLMLGQVLLADHNKAGAKAALEKAAGYSTNLWACRRAAELLAGLETSASKEI